MQIKVFNIRLNKDDFAKDQELVNEFLQKVKFKKSSTQLIEGKTNFWSLIIHYEEIEEDFTETIVKEEIVLDEEKLTDEEKDIVACFKQWRLDKAKENLIPSYMILSNKTIVSIAKNKPDTIEDLDRIYGIGEAKKLQYGEDIIALLNSI
ncbi:MAG: HRDC domain-containing protein [Bacteroidota bacterium]